MVLLRRRRGMNGTTSHISPQIKNSHDQQDERGWKNQRYLLYLPGQARRWQVQVVGEVECKHPEKITVQNEPRSSHQQCQPADQATLSPEPGRLSAPQA